MCGRYQFSAAENDDLRQIVRSVQKRCGQDELNFCKQRRQPQTAAGCAEQS